MCWCKFVQNAFNGLDASYRHIDKHTNMHPYRHYLKTPVLSLGYPKTIISIENLIKSFTINIIFYTTYSIILESKKTLSTKDVLLPEDTS